MVQSDLSVERQVIDVERILEHLARGEVLNSHGLLPWSSNYTFLVSVRHEDMEMLAVYKPSQGERPLWDFPHGTLAKREIAAFHVSQALGWELVPPTAACNGFLGPGAVQLFVEADPEAHYFTLRDEHQSIFERVAAFDYIINNADRKGGHCLKGTDGHIWFIDHGLTFHSDYKLRTVIWDYAGQPIPDDILADLTRLQDKLHQSSSPLLNELAQLITNHETEMFRRRLGHLITSGTFPLPGTGRNIPYPLI